MPRSGDPTRQRILDAGFHQFFRHGFGRVALSDIAEQAGVTKRTVYHHFASKTHLVEAVLASAQDAALAEIASWGNPRAGNVGALVDSLFEGLLRWARRPRWTGSGFTRIAMELADLHGHPARHAASRHKALVEQWLATEFDRLGAKRPDEDARSLMVLVEGAMNLTLIHRDAAYVDAAHAAAKSLFAADDNEGVRRPVEDTPPGQPT